MAKEYEPIIKVSPDGLIATIKFPAPPQGTDKPSFSVNQITEFLKEKEVIFGVDKKLLMDLSQQLVFDREFVIATGIAALESKPGYYEYFFDTNISPKPTIREDGSADYLNIKTMEVVHQNDVIALYHPAVQGTPGRSVRYTPIEPRVASELSPLGGRGFQLQADGVTYISLMDGKIEMSGPRIIISPVHEVHGDCDISTGNINFNGDVVIYGGVHDGVSIKASGNITIHGLVELCEIECGKNLHLLAGTKGGGKTKISAQGDITGEFIEDCTLTCGGDLTCDVIFQSRVRVDGKITLTGDTSSIIASFVSSIQGIEVKFIGNDFGVMTTVCVGLTKERTDALDLANRRIMALNSNLARAKRGIATYETMEQEGNIVPGAEEKKAQLRRMKIRDEALLAKEKAAVEHMEEMYSKGRNATIRCLDTCFANTVIVIDNNTKTMNDTFCQVEFVKSDTGIRMETLR